MVRKNFQTPKGFFAKGIACGIKDSGKLDLGMITSQPPAKPFAVFTSNLFPAAPVIYGRQIINSKSRVSHLVVNSGIANACTGNQGMEDLLEITRFIKSGFKTEDAVLMSSTGVIGTPLPVTNILGGLSRLVENPPAKWDFSFSEAIMTTDTVPKNAFSMVQLESGDVIMAGTAKGSGMICPNMATMLGFICTDIRLPDYYQKTFQSAIQHSFNSITVDGDMSTNDTVYLLANGASGIDYNNLSESDKHLFNEALVDICQDLAIQIIRDGEGATTLVKITVDGAKSDKEARIGAQTVANSPLVKTAVFGKDPNWGRIVASIGGSGISLRPDQFDLSICQVPVIKNGEPLKLDAKALSNKMDQGDVEIQINLNMSRGHWTYWTCDFTYDYVKINAEYHT